MLCAARIDAPKDFVAAVFEREDALTGLQRTWSVSVVRLSEGEGDRSDRALFGLEGQKTDVESFIGSMKRIFETKTRKRSTFEVVFNSCDLALLKIHVHSDRLTLHIQVDKDLHRIIAGENFCKLTELSQTLDLGGSIPLDSSPDDVIHLHGERNDLAIALGMIVDDLEKETMKSFRCDQISESNIGDVTVRVTKEAALGHCITEDSRKTNPTTSDDDWEAEFWAILKRGDLPKSRVGSEYYSVFTALLDVPKSLHEFLTSENGKAVRAVRETSLAIVCLPYKHETGETIIEVIGSRSMVEEALKLLEMAIAGSGKTYVSHKMSESEKCLQIKYQRTFTSQRPDPPTSGVQKEVKKKLKLNRKNF